MFDNIIKSCIYPSVAVVYEDAQRYGVEHFVKEFNKFAAELSSICSWANSRLV